jgi:hypothetical protein
MILDERPITVTCNSCGKSGETWDGGNPHAAVECDCCPEKHDHAGRGCRTVTITAFAHLTIINASDLLEALGMAGQDDAAPDLAASSLP